MDATVAGLASVATSTTSTFLTDVWTNYWPVIFSILFLLGFVGLIYTLIGRTMGVRGRR